MSSVHERPDLSAKNRIFGIAFVLCFSAIVAWVWGGLPRFDPPEYFEFADRRAWFGVLNSMDVLSNFAFIWVGAYWWRKLSLLRRSMCASVSGDGKLGVGGAEYGQSSGLVAHFPIYRFIAVASVLTGLGSIWFHWNPNVETLFWDRLPMTLGFSGMIGLLAADRYSEKVGRILAVVLSVVAVAHLILWATGHSDLRPYIVLQYGGVLFGAALLVVRWKWGVLSSRIVLWAFLFYVAAKVTEVKDASIFALTDGVISGHTAKHLLAAVAIDRLFFAGSPKK